MFTAMVRRPVVWLLATLALLGAGWAAYGPLRQALGPVMEMVQHGSQSEQAAAPESPPAPPVSAPASPAAPSTAATQVPAAPKVAAVKPESPAPPGPATSAQPASAAPPGPAEASQPPAVAAEANNPPASAPAAPTGATSAEPERAPARFETAAKPTAPATSAAPPATLAPSPPPAATPAATRAAPPEPVAPQPGPTTGGGPSETRLGELAPAAGEPAPPPTPVAPLPSKPEGPIAASPSAPAAAIPPEPVATVVAPSGAPPAPGAVAALPEASSVVAPEPRPSEARPETPAPAPSAAEHPSAAPEVAKAAPLPSTETQAPPPPSLSLDTIRRVLAALLGGTPGPKDLPGQKVEKPEPAPPAPAAPEHSQELAKAVEPSGGEPAIVRPSFDIVRVGREGRAVVAGRAAPGAEVELLAGDRVLDRVRADQRGEWVSTPAKPLAPGALELSLRATSEGAPAVEAKQVVVVVVPEPLPPQPPPIAVAEGPLPQPPPVAGAEGPPPQPPEVRLADGPSGPLAVLLSGDGRAPGRILQAPGRISSDGRLALLVLDYDERGRTRLTGEAPPGAPLRIYVDNQPAAEAVAEPSGKWTAVLEHNLAPGQYTLRLDELGKTGRPVARLETPFTRVGQPPIPGKTQVDYVIVQPGNSLWRISRRLYGRGMEYVQIYDANKAQIRDPDLIYPGQVFEIPRGARSAG
jgi:nucleoid-associated protein YgaU